MRVGCARHAEGAAGSDDVLAVVPVGAFGDVGLFSPRLRRCRRKVCVEIVETQQGRPKQLAMCGPWLMWINGNRARGSTAGCFASLKICGSTKSERKEPAARP